MGHEIVKLTQIVLSNTAKKTARLLIKIYECDLDLSFGTYQETARFLQKLENFR